MTTPFLALAPNQPRVIDVGYIAAPGICSDVTDASDTTDQTDQTDVTDGGEVII